MNSREKAQKTQKKTEISQKITKDTKADFLTDGSKGSKVRSFLWGCEEAGLASFAAVYQTDRTATPKLCQVLTFASYYYPLG